MRVEGGNAALTPPTVLKAAENPGLDQKAIDAKVSGTLTLIFSVSDSGRVEEVWVAKPLGSGLDESAAKSLGESTFSPATLEGKPGGGGSDPDAERELSARAEWNGLRLRRLLWLRA